MKKRSALLAGAVIFGLLASAHVRRADAQDSVATAVADSMARRRTPFSISVVDGKQSAVVPWASPLGLLIGKVPGLRAVPASSQPGTVPALRLRSASGLAGEPLVVVDGIVSRISSADLHSLDVERIEVMTGAAAGTVYGSGAANGVIHVITKRGQGADGARPSFSFRSEMGLNSTPRRLPFSVHHHYQMNAAGTDYVRDASGNLMPEPDGIVDNPFPVINDLRAPLLDTRSVRSAYLSATDRIGTTSYYLSAQHDRDPGFFRLQSGLARRSARLNVDHALGGRLRLTAQGFFSRSSSELLENEGAWLQFIRRIQPSAKLDSVTSNCPDGMATCYVQDVERFVANPLYALHATDRDDRRNRTRGSVGVTYQLTPWLSARASYSNDQLVERAWRYQSFAAFGPFPASTTRGEELDGWRHVVSTAATLTAHRSWFGGAVRQDATISWTDERQKLSESASQTFVQSGSPPTSGVSLGTRWNEHLSGVALATQFDVAGGIVVDGGIRREASNRFDRPDARVYHRMGVAYVARDGDAGFLKLRVAHGTAAQAVPHQVQPRLIPVPTNTFPAYSYARVVPMAHETELGVDGRLPFGIDLSAVYSQRTADELVITQGTSSGGLTFLALQNSARVSGRTISLNLGGDILKGGAAHWRVDVAASRTRSRYSRASNPGLFWGPGFAFKVTDGSDVGTIYGLRWIRTQAQLDETIANGMLAGPADAYRLNEEGYFVRNAEYHTINETPLVYSPPGAPGLARLPLGTTTPDFEVGLNNSVSWRSLTARAGIVAVLGGKVYNEARRATFLSGRDPLVDQSGKPQPANCPQTVPVDPCAFSTGRKPLRYYQVIALTATENFVEDGSFARVREMAVEWRLPQRWLTTLPFPVSGARFALIGRNLWTITRYSGYDPDVASTYHSALVYRVDTGTSYPSYRSASAALSLDF